MDEMYMKPVRGYKKEDVFRMGYMGNNKVQDKKWSLQRFCRQNTDIIL